ncbi:MAG: hypothetical protein ACREA0_20535 [bacterium]
MPVNTAPIDYEPLCYEPGSIPGQSCGFQGHNVFVIVEEREGGFIATRANYIEKP